jgi:hypothetical protein
MKECAWCGRENDDDAIYCRECGTTFAIPGPPEPPAEQKTETVDEFPELEPDVSPGGEYALCPSCVFPNVPDVQWCKRCGAPLNFISTIGPLEHLYAEGFAYRRAVRGRPKFVVVLGIWLLFLPGLLGCISVFCGTVGNGALDGLAIFWPSRVVTISARAGSNFSGGHSGFMDVLLVLLSVFWGAVCAVMLYRVTKNYLTIPKLHLDDTATSPVLPV